MKQPSGESDIFIGAMRRAISFAVKATAFECRQRLCDRSLVNYFPENSLTSAADKNEMAHGVKSHQGDRLLYRRHHDQGRIVR